MKNGAVIARFILGVLLSCGLLAGLLYPCLPFGGAMGAEAGGNYLTKVYENATAGDLVEKTQNIWGWVLLGLNLVAVAGILACPTKDFTSKKGQKYGARLFFPAFCGTLVLLGMMVVLCSPGLLAGFLQFRRWYSFATVSASFLLVLLVYLLGSRSVPLFRSVEGLGSGFPKGLRIAEGLLVALFAAAALYVAWYTMRWYLLPVGILLALLPGTLCEWALAKRRSGLRVNYLCLRTLRALGLVTFFPVTLPVLLIALFSSRASTSSRASSTSSRA